MQKLRKGESCGRNELSDAGVKEFPRTEWISRDETIEREVCVYRVKRRNLAENASRRNSNKFSTTKLSDYRGFESLLLLFYSINERSRSDIISSKLDEYLKTIDPNDLDTRRIVRIYAPKLYFRKVKVSIEKKKIVQIYDDRNIT